MGTKLSTPLKGKMQSTMRRSTEVYELNKTSASNLGYLIHSVVSRYHDSFPLNLSIGWFID